MAEEINNAEEERAQDDQAVIMDLVENTLPIGGPGMTPEILARRIGSAASRVAIHTALLELIHLGRARSMRHIGAHPPPMQSRSGPHIRYWRVK